MFSQLTHSTRLRCVNGYILFVCIAYRAVSPMLGVVSNVLSVAGQGDVFRQIGSLYIIGPIPIYRVVVLHSALLLQVMASSL